VKKSFLKYLFTVIARGHYRRRGHYFVLFSEGLPAFRQPVILDRCRPYRAWERQGRSFHRVVSCAIDNRAFSPFFILWLSRHADGVPQTLEKAEIRIGEGTNEALAPLYR
jgi:hypothetical protein